MALPFRARTLLRLVLPACIIAATAPSAAAQSPAGVHISPAEGSIGESTPTITIMWTHGTNLNAGSLVIQVTKNGVTTNVTGLFSYSAEMVDPNTTGVLMAKSVGTVSLASTGTTRVRGYICGPTSADCGESIAEYVYTPPPPPAQRAAPSVSFAPYSRAVRDATRDGSSSSYSTPSYVSLGEERSLTLFYSSELANPRPLITMDVTDHSLSPAGSFSVKAWSAAGTPLTLSNGQTEAVYANTGGATGDTVRIGVQFDIDGLPAGNRTGVHLVTVEVTSRWTDETKSRTETVPVMVLDLTKPLYGRGWWVLGLQRAYPVTQGVMVHNGDGTLLLFTGTGPTYVSPPGERSTLTRIAGDSIRRAYPDGSVATFTAAGTLAYVRSLAGQKVTYAYGDTSRLVSVTDPAGLQTTLAYGNDATFGRYLTSITTPGARQTSVVHAASFTEQEFFDPDGVRALRQVRNSVGRMTSAVDRSGGAWTTSYHSVGQLFQTLAPTITARGQSVRPRSRAHPERLMYLPGGGQGTLSAPMARVKPADVNARFTGALDDTTRVWSDRFGLPLKIVGPLGHTTEMARDTVGRPRIVSAPDGTQTLVGWNDDGNVDNSFSEAQGEQTTTEYGTFSGVHLAVKIVQGGREVRFWRDSVSGQVRAIIVQGDTMVWHTYDSRGRVVTSRYRDARVVRNFYDGTAWKNADSVRVESSSGAQTTAFTFDAFGRVRTVRDPTGRITTDSLDLVGRLMKRRAPGDSVRFAYDSVGLWRVTDAAGKVFETQRNRLGWVHTELDPNGRASTAAYDSAGRVVSSTDRLGRTVAFQYDVLGRTTRNLVGTDTIRYKYHDPSGDYFVVWNAESRDSVTYNAAGQVLTTVRTMGGNTFRIQNQYGSDGLRTYRQAVSPAVGNSAWNATVGYGYDSRQRLDTITDSPGSTSTGVSYDVPGRLEKLTYPGTIGTLTLGYDSRSQISYNWYSNSSIQGSFGASLTYDVLGRRSERTGESGYRKRVHSYDGPGQMTGFSDERWTYFPPQLCNPEFPEGSCEGYYDWLSVGSGNYGYDAVGNRAGWSVTDSVGTTTSSSATLQPTSNRYASFDGWTLTYDSIGNLVRRQKGTQELRYHWNARGQLTGVGSSASDSVTYGYNGLGMRVRRTQGSVIQRYLYDEASNLVAELGSTGNPLRTYTHLGLDQPHSMRTWSGTTPGAVHYYALDLPGNNVNGLFNGSGTVTHRYHYTPWGQAQSTSEATYNPLRYASRELDPASGLYYNRARWYDPYLGRFISEDPIGIDGGINVYAYAGNDPVNFTDPWGLAPYCPAGCDFTVVGTARNPWDGVQDSDRPRSIFGDGAQSPRSDDGSAPPLIDVKDHVDEQLPSCRSYEVSGRTGTIYVQTDAAGFVSWGIYMHDRTEGKGFWRVNVYVGKTRVDGKLQMYSPHGSVHPNDARSGSVLRFEAEHVDLRLRTHRSITNGCIIP